MERSDALKVGLISLVSLVLVLGVVFWLRGRTLLAGHPYTVTFTDVDGLQESAPVNLMGIRVGFVETVQPTFVDGRYRVNVGFTISHPELDSHHTAIPRGSRLTIQQSGLIGEKFLEITPPRPQSCVIDQTDATIQPNTPVVVTYQDKALTVGSLQNITFNDGDNKQTLTYQLSQANVLLPPDVTCEVHTDSEGDRPNRTIALVHDTFAQQPAPDIGGYFTVEAPMRLKTFLDVQLETAEALRDTNLKIAQLLSEDTIASLSQTVANTEVLTAQAAKLLADADTLIATARGDVHRLVDTVDSLSTSVASLSDNVNDVLEDDTLRDNLKATVASIRGASQSLETLLASNDLTQTLAYTKDTAADTAAIMAQLREFSDDPTFQQEFRQSVTLLNQSLAELHQLLGAVNAGGGKNGQDLTELVEDAKSTVDNLNQFSEKLDGHFTLWRLLF